MEPVPDVIPLTDFRKDAARIIGGAAATGIPVYLTQHGRVTAVLISRNDYASLVHRAAASAEATGDAEGRPPAPAAAATMGDPPPVMGARACAPTSVQGRWGMVDPETAAFLIDMGFGPLTPEESEQAGHEGEAACGESPSVWG